MIKPRLRRSQTLQFIFGIYLITQQTACVAEQEKGREVYLKWCAPCHMDSPFAPATIRLKHTRGEALAVLEKRNDLSPDYIRILVRKGVNGMPLFRKTEISDQQLEELVNYLTTR